MNAAGMAKNIAHVIFYGPLEYQGIGVQNPYILQGIIHITTFLNEGACDSSTGELLRANAELFRVEMGIPFSLTITEYNKKTYAAYMPSGWYKNLLKFMSMPIFDLEVKEDYQDMPILHETDVYLMESFVEWGFRNADLKSLNFVWKYLQAVTLADIAKVTAFYQRPTDRKSVGRW